MLHKKACPSTAVSQFWSSPPKDVRLRSLPLEEIMREGDVYLSLPFSPLVLRHLYLTPSFLCYSTVLPT